ncbi:hypothetical protein [Lentilactobacillus kosonis]|uniref:hypothetical protein n=1 Tax=Lentilactobacillus kosonis TaxID=2810561 RepID=UPI000F61A3C1|nr:hypothetical protein [Lentilactobacillus kosonis]
MFTIVLSKLNQDTKRIVSSRLGSKSQVIIGSLGIIIHETSHALVALIFGHHIISMRLIKFPSPHDSSLGYVNHSWNPNNFYQRIGNLFIGIAPTFGCSLVVLLAYRILFPISFNSVLLAIKVNNLQSIKLPDFNIFNYLIFLIMAITICVGGFDLSSADFDNSKQGILPTLIALSLITIALSVTPFFSNIIRAINHFMIGIAIIFNFQLGSFVHYPWPN